MTVLAKKLEAAVEGEEVHDAIDGLLRAVVVLSYSAALDPKLVFEIARDRVEEIEGEDLVN